MSPQHVPTLPLVARVDTMPPGRDIDQLVAIRVCHWRFYEYMPGRTGPGIWAEWLDRHNDVQSAGNDGGFHPSLHWDHAMRAALRYPGTFVFERREADFVVTFSINNRHFTSSGPAGPLVVCRALLKAVT